MIVFTLTLWNSNNEPMESDFLFAKVRPYKLAGHVEHKIYSYTFETGNKVLIEVRESANNKEPDIIRKRSSGFGNCDWMIDEIIQFGRIRTDSERRLSSPFKDKGREAIQAEIIKLREELEQIKEERTKINNRYNETNTRLRQMLDYLTDTNNWGAE